MSRTNAGKRFASGAMAGFTVLPMFTAPRHQTVTDVDSVGIAWSRVNRYLSHGVTETYESERSKQKQPKQKACTAA